MLCKTIDFLIIKCFINISMKYRTKNNTQKNMVQFDPLKISNNKKQYGHSSSVACMTNKSTIQFYTGST